VPEAKDAPPILILAEPLIQAGLERLLEESFQLKAASDPDKGAIALVIWSISAGMPAATLERELAQLRDRWQPAPLLLLLPAESDLPSSWLLQLPAEGLLQQAEPQEIRAAVDTLLTGGRVVELRPLRWIEAEALRCRRWLDLQPVGLNALLLAGRLRELALAKRLLLWLWGPISMAFPSEAPLQRPEPQAVVGITLRERTAIGVWEAIQERLITAASTGLSNQSGQLMALEGLNTDHRRDLLLALLAQFDLLITRFRHEQLRGVALEERWLGQQPELRRLSMRAMAGEYVQLPLEGGLLPVAQSLSEASDLTAVDPELPAALPMLAALVCAQPILVDGRLLAPDEPQALLHLEALISNWLIRTAELISAEILASCSTWPDLRRYLLRSDLLPTRNLERLRNQLNSQQRWDSLFERPVQLYESRRLLYGLKQGAIVPIEHMEPRDRELQQLSWGQQLITLVLEGRDALAPQVQALFRRLGDLVVVVLTQVIGRAIGLVGRGILQGMGRSIGRGS
jgi:hypothetical protein